jgi:uncharacterized protein (TIGR03000 family)
MSRLNQLIALASRTERIRVGRYFLLSAVFAAIVTTDVMALPSARPQRAVATISVRLPADAQLTFDGQGTRSTSDHRVFTTPPLEVGKTFEYTLSVKFVGEGKTTTVEQKIYVKAGQETTALFYLPMADSSSVARYSYTSSMDSETGSNGYDREKRDAAKPNVVHFSGRPVPVGGFHPVHWGPDPSDPFYHSGQ